jgi:alkylhydroperoxidase family enzyme
LPVSQQRALDFVDQLLYAPDRVTDEDFERLRTHFSEFEIVELCYFVLYQNISHRFAAAVGVDPPAEVTVKSLGDLYKE